MADTADTAETQMFQDVPRFSYHGCDPDDGLESTVDSFDLAEMFVLCRTR